jgi:hypothetical protein
MFQNPALIMQKLIVTRAFPPRQRWEPKDTYTHGSLPSIVGAISSFNPLRDSKGTQKDKHSKLPWLVCRSQFFFVM